MKSRANKIALFIVINLLILFILYFIPIEKTTTFDLCIYKRITGNECWNCGMTRAFLSMLRLDFEGAWQFNKNVVVVFPLAIFLYTYTWYKYIIKKEEKKNG